MVKLHQISKSYQAYNDLPATYRKINNEELINILALLEKDMKYEPGYWSFYCSTLFRYQKDSLLKEKIRCWNTVFPTVGAHLMWGDVHLRNNNLNEAESNYTKAHYMIPTRQSARGKLVWLYRQRGEEERALRLAGEILSEKVKIYSFETYTLHQNLKEAFGEDIINLINLKKH